MARKALKSTITPPVKPSNFLKLPDNPVKSGKFTIISKSKLDRRKQYGAVKYHTTLIVKALDKKLKMNIKKFQKKGNSHIHNVEDLIPRIKEYLTNLYGNVVILPKIA